MELVKVTAGTQRSLRETLRWATRDAHARLDASFEGVTDPERTALYDVFVRMNHACHAVLEPLLDASPLTAIVPRNANRLRSLRADMEALGLRPLDLPAFAPARLTLHEACGVAYVLEGSRLGATLILRRMDEAAAAGRGDRSRQYLADSAHAGEFKALMDTLSALDWDADTLNDAARAATATFDYFSSAARLAGSDAR